MKRPSSTTPSMAERMASRSGASGVLVSNRGTAIGAPTYDAPIHVGLDLVYFQPDSGGSGTYARELVRALHAVAPGIRITAWVGTGAPDVDWGVEWVRLPVKST